MVSPAWGPFLLDTSAESWLARSNDSMVRDWFRAYLSLHQVHVSAVTVIERIRGYALLSRRAQEQRRETIEGARLAALRQLGHVWPRDTPDRVVAGGAQWRLSAATHTPPG